MTSPAPALIVAPEARVVEPSGFKKTLPVVADYQATGLSLRDHPMKFLRRGLGKMGVAKASDLAVLPVDRLVKVAGLTLMAAHAEFAGTP